MITMITQESPDLFDLTTLLAFVGEAIIGTRSEQGERLLQHQPRYKVFNLTSSIINKRKPEFHTGDRKIKETSLIFHLRKHALSHFCPILFLALIASVAHSTTPFSKTPALVPQLIR